MDDCKPFPVHLLPDVVAKFVTETAQAMQCDPAMVALPALSTLAAAIGTTRSVSPRDGWNEPPVVWSAIIQRSGSVKTPPAEAAINPLDFVQQQELIRHRLLMDEHKSTRLLYEKSLAAWKRLKDGGNPPKEPKAPACIRHIVDDITIEGLAPILQENPRGVLLAPDELDGWVSSMGQYKRSGACADRPKWLKMHRKGTLIVDRKTNRETIYVNPACVCIAGTVQPSIFANSMRGENTSSGLAARLLLWQPKPRCKVFSRISVSRSTTDQYHKTVDSLLTLMHVEDDDDGPRPYALGLTPDALKVFEDFYNRNGLLQHQASDEAEAAALAKLEGYALRFALIFALVESPNADRVSLDAMRRGVALAEAFAYEARRIYGRMSDDDQTVEDLALIEWIERQGGTVTARDLTRGPRQYRGDPEKAEKTLLALVGGGWAARDDLPAAAGRPAIIRIRLINGGSGDETTETPTNGEFRRRHQSSDSAAQVAGAVA